MDSAQYHIENPQNYNITIIPDEKDPLIFYFQNGTDYEIGIGFNCIEVYDGFCWKEYYRPAGILLDGAFANVHQQGIMDDDHYSMVSIIRDYLEENRLDNRKYRIIYKIRNSRAIDYILEPPIDFYFAYPLKMDSNKLEGTSNCPLP